MFLGILLPIIKQLLGRAEKDSVERDAGDPDELHLLGEEVDLDHDVFDEEDEDYDRMRHERHQ